MKPADRPPGNLTGHRLMVIDAPSKKVMHVWLSDLAQFLRSGDVLVVNDAATFPGSLRAVSGAGRRYEVRLLSHRRETDWTTVLFGDGDWRTPTERRPVVEAVRIGTKFTFDDDLSAEVIWISDITSRLATIRFRQDEPSMWSAIYRLGGPIQYSYLSSTLDLWSVQTAYSSRPWATEMPSAGRPLRWGLLQNLMQQGIRVSPLTHETGLSSTGDPALDAMLPLPERFEIPESTVAVIRDTKNRGGRVIAVGTSVVRALEGNTMLHEGRLVSGSGETDLKIWSGYQRHVVDGILTGIHEPSESHFRLLEAFVDPKFLRRAHAAAEEIGYLSHEFGDSCLILNDTNVEIPLGKVA